MVIFQRLIEAGVFCGYYKKQRLSNNQTVFLFLIKEKLNKYIEWNVALAIAYKRKDVKAWIRGEKTLDYCTGECGLEGLIWAKNTLKEFEYFIKREKVRQRIIVSWTDNKKKKVYVKYLGKMKYKHVNHYGKQVLIKNI
ncbi:MULTISPECIES: hypothetical protein [unclassified Clostridioides]|uniref:hypothetical protein n=1 Tax=unclassified Clostridioides TaxID=2635829 RepID=UPI001D12B0FB|nr:hypothetical protein [Clostridioides sp. ES-S-0049-03]MCC0705121.1 hypothetical protein [Clostridioides sp. ES-S-0049-02]